ncbi:ribosome biogenesis GTPase Der [Desulfotalea psychrophila]|uniref:GTPase Der n=1 Tax=Desulfotalea psychrophila (strain LSv54 / DSM 12343) TaxID=177439 RepID=Q6AJ12_DESPS|nr:ribosome biogenesis GTPase Der [Desulfotalea psychrophila]CAG37668.1 Probable GTP-binding protein (EngA) [Desulfotalea psychrophila LSv54]
MSNSSCPIVALVGRPNVGKSTLFNRITKSRNALVDPTPGVTRDRQYERVVWNNRAMILVDTGGIDDNPEDVLVPHIRDQALAAIEEADIVLFLMDGREGLTPADYEVVDILRRAKKPVYHVINKIDGPEKELELLCPFYELGVETLWSLSADHTFGFNTLMDALSETIEASTMSQDLPDGTVKVAFFGRPNVGKSSMINRILGEDRMIVSEISGTTRDSVDTLLTHGNYSYLLIDTAGIRRKGKTTEKLEKFSILKSLGALERCDVAVILIDADEGITEQDTKVIGYALDQGRGLIILVNKWDLLEGDKKRQDEVLAEVGRQLPFIGFAPLLTVSALSGFGIKRLFPVIGSVYRQYSAQFSTSTINRLLREAVTVHAPPIYKNKRLKFYYSSQIGTCPPKFVIMSNSSKGVHFSYQRFLSNRYREGLGLDKVPIQLIFKDKSGQRV